MITLNPAKQLGIDKRTGSIEIGKDADIVIWDAHPFSVYARPDMTIIEGEIYFDRERDLLQREANVKEREALEKLDVNRPPGAGAPTTAPRRPSEKRIADRDEADGGNH